jgi:two-component system chemotaxis response regulator CheY
MATPTAPNIPPAALTAQGRVREVPRLQFAYDPHRPATCRYDPMGAADQIEEILAASRTRPLTDDESWLLFESLRQHEPWLEWAGKREQEPGYAGLRVNAGLTGMLTAISREFISEAGRTHVAHSVATVLVVDDTPQIRRLIRFALEGRGHRTLEAGDGVEGLRLAGVERPALVITDVTMPGPSGLEVCRMIRADAEHAALPVIILTAGTHVSEAEARAAGASAFLTKPFSPAALLDVVSALLGP